jgi:hypothetical protein
MNWLALQALAQDKERPHGALAAEGGEFSGRTSRLRRTAEMEELRKLVRELRASAKRLVELA